MKRRIEKLVLAFILLLFLLLSSRDKAEENPNTLLYSQLPIVKSREEYKKLFHREPPIGFDQWVQFAKEKKCLLNLSFYSQIYRDLEPWIHEKHDVEFG